MIKGYGVEVVGDEIWITEKVNNLLLRNEKTVEKAVGKRVVNRDFY